MMGSSSLLDMVVKIFDCRLANRALAHIHNSMRGVGK